MSSSHCLYDVLGVARDADAAAIRKAYLKMAILLHPDKNPEDDRANDKFQKLQKVYSILSDPQKRKTYDRTGSVEDSEDLFGENFEDFYRHYRGMHDPLTTQMVDDFAQKYRGSDAERADLLKRYERCKGNMKLVFQWVILSDPGVDSHRFKKLLDEAIKLGEIKRYMVYTTWAEKVKATKPKSSDKQKESKTSKRKNKSNEKGDEGALAAMILQGRYIREEGLSGLAEKYGVLQSNEPTEEEFQAARQRLEGRQTRSKKQK